MSNGNEEIVKRFVESKAIDFHAIGKLVTELGPGLAARDHGAKMVLIGRPFIIACLMPPAEINQLVSQVGGGQLAAALKE